MARKQTPERLLPPSLVVPRSEAATKIQAQINKGLPIRDMPIRSKEDLSKAWAEENKWSKYNSELLTRLFDNPSIAQEYDYQGVVYIPTDSGGAWRLLLAKEIREAGIEIDLNKAL
ncbi:MAG TPA: hypothetical protein VKB86_11595 [Pyrinomonadaceae bacterium]|nr:hypothetical protein [Pyrinomonadaceae bacterium]